MGERSHGRAVGLTAVSVPSRPPPILAAATTATLGGASWMERLCQRPPENASVRRDLSAS